MSAFVKCQYEICENTFKGFMRGRNVKKYCSVRCWSRHTYQIEKQVRDARKAQFAEFKKEQNLKFNNRFNQNRYKFLDTPPSINFS